MPSLSRRAVRLAGVGFRGFPGLAGRGLLIPELSRRQYSGPDGSGHPTDTFAKMAQEAKAVTQNTNQIGGPGIGPADADMAAMFTCGACNVRVMKAFSRHSYEKGVVIVECPGCHNLHVLADNLGWFGEERNVEEILKAKGEEVLRGKLIDGEVVIT